MRDRVTLVRNRRCVARGINRVARPVHQAAISHSPVVPTGGKAGHVQLGAVIGQAGGGVLLSIPLVVDSPLTLEWFAHTRAEAGLERSQAADQARYGGSA